MADQQQVSQLIAQVEWADPTQFKVSQVAAQVEYETAGSEHTLYFYGAESGGVPNTWTRVGTAPASFGTQWGGSSTYPNMAAHSGSGGYYFIFPIYAMADGATTGAAIPCELVGRSGGLLRFWMSQDDGYNTKDDVLEVYYGATSDLASATLLDTFHRVGPKTWVQRSIVLPAEANNANGYLFLLGRSRYGNNIYVDDIEVVYGYTPPAQTYDETTAETATLSEEVTASMSGPGNAAETVTLSDTVTDEIQSAVNQHYETAAESATLSESLEVGGSYHVEVAETLNLADVGTLASIYDEALADQATLSDSAIEGDPLQAVVAETITTEDALAGNVGKLIADYLQLTAAMVGNWQSHHDLAETLTVTDAPAAAKAFLDLVAETAGVSDSLPQFALGARLAEVLVAGDLLAPNWTSSHALADGISLAERLEAGRAFLALLADEGVFSDAPGTPEVGVLLAEVMRAAESLAVNWQGSETVADRVALAEALNAARAFSEIAADVALFADNLPSLTLTVFLVEILRSRDTLAANWTGSETAAERVTFAEALVGARAFLALLADTAAMSDDLASPALGVKLAEILISKESVVANWSGGRGLFEVMTLNEALAGARVFLALIAESVTLTEEEGAALGVIVKEIVAQLDQVGVNWTGTKALAEAMRLLDSTIDAKGYGAFLAEIVALADDPMALMALTLMAADTVAAAEGVATAYEASPAVKDRLFLEALPAANAELSGYLAEVARFSFSVMLDGDLYQAWSFTGDTFDPALFTNFAFNSFAVTEDGRVFGAKEEGVFELDGESDAGAKIETGVRLNFFTFGTHHKKRLYRAYFGLAGMRPVLKVIADDREIRYYVVNGKADLARGVMAHEWELVLADIDSLDFVEVAPIILSR